MKGQPTGEGFVATCDEIRAPYNGGVAIISADANEPDQIEGALRTLSDERADVIIVLQTSMLLTYSRQIAALALEKRITIKPMLLGRADEVIE